MRVDAGVARILGISRTTAAELAAAGDITVDGIAAGKSDKLPVGAMLDVLLPRRRSRCGSSPPRGGPCGRVPRLGHHRRRQAGRRGRASFARLERPDCRRSTGGRGLSGLHLGAAERQGIVQRLDVGTSGLMVLAVSEHAYSVLRRPSATGPSRSATTPWCRDISIRRRAPSTRRSADIPATIGDSR